MALTKDYQISVLEVMPDGSAYLTLKLCVVDEGILAGVPLNYRAVVSTQNEVSDALTIVNEYLTTNGYPVLTPEDTAFITETIAAARTNPGKAAIPSE